MPSLVPTQTDRYHEFRLIENYIYLYHTKTFVIIPTFNETVNDTMGVSFEASTPMSRSAPIYSYANSGPRSLQVGLQLHRDLFVQMNQNVSNAPVTPTDDYVDVLIKQLQAAAYPVYGGSQKLVDPPMVALRFGDEIFIKGIVNGSVSVTYGLPVLENNKYAIVGVGFTINEVDPYDANQVMINGSWRGFDSSLERNVWNTARGGGGNMYNGTSYSIR